MNLRWIQIVNWFPEWIGIGKSDPYPPYPDWLRGSIYSRRYRLGFIEIRKWAALGGDGKPKIDCKESICKR